MHVIEDELIKACNYKIQRKFSDRQDYLKSIFNAAQKLADDEFDSLSDPAAQWLNDCVQAYNTSRKSDLPDFDEVNQDGIDDEPEPDEDEAVDDSEGGEAEEVATEDPDNDSDGGTDDAVEQLLDEDEPAPRKSKKVTKAKQKKDVKEIKPPKPVPKAKRIKDDPLPEFESDAVIDKWGAIVGSKNSLALALFEKGATTREVKEKLGGTYYNILGKMEQRGHKLEKEGNLVTLTHKDDVKVLSRKSKK